MNLSGLLPLIEQQPAFIDLRNALQAQSAVAADAIESARAPLIVALAREMNKAIVVVTARSDRAKQLTDEINVWVREGMRTSLFAEPDPLFYERMPWSPETIASRLNAMAAIAVSSNGGTRAVQVTRRRTGERLPSSSGIRQAVAPIVVTSIRALMQKTLPPGEFRSGVRVMRRGESTSLGELLSTLVVMGYQPEPVVETPGSFSRRGGILDIWTPADLKPIRVEFIGDEVASLRAFDPGTQRSASEIEALTIVPASEALPGRGRQVLEKIESWDLAACHPIAASAMKQDRNALEEGHCFRGIEFYLPYFYQTPASMIDHLPETGLLVLESWGEIEATAQALAAQAEEVRGDLEARRELPPHVAPPYLDWEVLREQVLARHRLLFDYASPGESLALPFSPNPRYGGQLRKVMDELKRLHDEHARVVVVTRQADRLSDLLRERDIFISPKEHIDSVPEPGHLVLLKGALAEGWNLGAGNRKLETSDEPSSLPAPELERRAGPRGLVSGASVSNLYLLTDAELFGWSRPRPRRVGGARKASPEAFFADIAVGDHVVHVDHGIGVFRGLARIALNGPEREYLLVEYANNDQLYVPVHQIDRLGRYVGSDGHAPALHRLGTAEWTQVKERTRKAVADIADELLELYAAREVVSGHAFSRDNTWQGELESSFPYVETEDQLHAVDDVKADMERAKPMDRLVVGDVGYGKTEVALRVAFKAAMDGKQVVILVPTTVLAQQHYNTFKERLAPFPIQVEMLSRFRSDKEQKEIVEKIHAGVVDIVIGTHRLLSEDVVFKDLGLLIIDEEQRFGVVHKEKLKQLRKQVDTLTLTATPIPRTLYLSLSGARDMSTIETPPEDRLPIRTYVAEYEERLVRESILRELDRGGQVYFVHNRVRGIGIVADQLRKLVPEANIAIGHGQMPEEELERVMLEFATGKYDVLVCTTIIESGLDIPNANTIIINRADKFGLAQLYQLRGRVGRSAARAYAYFLYDKDQRLSGEARARLQTIAEASELGAGFQIAMRDLEIRGAGEILGAKQSGHIAAVGFDLYCRLLSSAIDEARAKEGAASEEAGGEGEAKGRARGIGYAPTIDLPLPAHIPDDYVRDAVLRLRLYRRLADISKPEQVDQIKQEFADRFGPLPDEFENLLYLLRIKVEALSARLESIAMEDGRILVKFGREDRDLQTRLNARYGERVKAVRDRAWLPGPDSDFKWQEHLMELVKETGR
jgi:transcription-repair coupling factor (superfamily II helicase)